MHNQPSTSARALWCLVQGALAAGLIGALSVATHTPFLFPALGGTIFTIAWAPRSPSASPRNVILGHTIGACVGWASVQAFQFHPEGGSLAFASPAQIGSVTCALGVTSALLIWLHTPHAPAGASTLIVSSGLMPRLEHIPVFMAGAVLACIVAWCLHRLRGEPFPLWAAHHAREEAA